MVGGQPPNARHRPAAPPTATSRHEREPDPKTGEIAGRRLRLPGTHAHARRPARRRAGKSWRAYVRGHRRRPARPADLPPSRSGRRRRHAEGARPATATRRATTRSSTSTRCSTSATARRTTSALDKLERATSPRRSHDAEPRLHRARPLQRRLRAHRAPTAARRAAAADAFLAARGCRRSSPRRPTGRTACSWSRSATARRADSSGCCGQTVGGGKTGTLLLSRYLKAGTSDATSYNTYSLLRTVEDVFGVSHLAEAAGRHVHPFGGGLVSGSGI